MSSHATCVWGGAAASHADGAEEGPGDGAGEGGGPEGGPQAQETRLDGMRGVKVLLFEEGRAISIGSGHGFIISKHDELWGLGYNRWVSPNPQPSPALCWAPHPHTQCTHSHSHSARQSPTSLPISATTPTLPAHAGCTDHRLQVWAVCAVPL